ncbi:NAD(P)-binding protein [Sarocladium strictum]
MASKEIVFITGANTGIGYETVKALLQSSQPHHVLLGARDVKKGDAAIQKLREEVPETSNTVEVVQIDVTDDDSVHKAIGYVKETFGKLDTLINNAGAQFDGLFTEDAPKAREIFNKDFDVNVSSAHVITLAAAPLLIASSSPRLVFITSGTATLIGNTKTLFPPWTPNPSGGWPKENLIVQPGYRASKTALNMLMLTWYWLLKEDGVKVFSVSPGFLATGLGGFGAEKIKAMGAKEPRIGGELLKLVVEGGRDEDAGKVVFQDGAVQDW